MMKKREIIIGAIMVAVIITSILIYLPKPAAPKKKTVKTAVKPTAAAPKTTRQPARQETSGFDRLLEQVSSQDAPVNISSLHDPFARQRQPAARLGSSDLVLSGIIWEEERPVALINDRAIAEGEQIAGFKVVKIMQDEVILARGSDRFILKFAFGLKKDTRALETGGAN
ncbi:MAG: hypothetical protein PHO42_01655 [Candidatus Omnitrophica bacterium]|nr:hypothetical protein [Candidatus Omnitrophota bacterium]